MRTLDALPVFTGKNTPTFDPASWRLMVEGAVGRRLALSLRELQRFPRVGVQSDFRCHEGWVVPNVRWEGVGLPPILSRARPVPAARFVTIHAGEYTFVFSLDEARHAGVLLATHMNGRPLPGEHGGPLRLVVPPTWDCFASVKWVQRIELTECRAMASGPAIALARIGERGPVPESPSSADDDAQAAGEGGGEQGGDRA